MGSPTLSRRAWWCAVILLVALAVVLLGLAGGVAAAAARPDHAFAAPVPLTPAPAAIAPAQPFSPLPNVVAAPLYYQHWQLVRALFQYGVVPTERLSDVEVAFDPFSTTLSASGCTPLRYQTDLLENQQYALKPVGTDVDCTGAGGEQFAILRNLLEATNTYGVVGPELVLRGPNVILRFAQTTPSPVDFGLQGGFDVWPPATMQALVDGAPLIVIGTVGPVARYWVHCGYGDNGQPITPCEPGGRGLPATDLLLNVEQVLRDDGTVARGGPVILTTLGYTTDWLRGTAGIIGFPLAYTGDRYLFLLAPNPDGRTYSPHYGPYGQLVVDGDTLRFGMDDFPPAQLRDDPAPLTLSRLEGMAQQPAATPTPRPTAALGAGLAPPPPTIDPNATPTPEPQTMYPRSLDELVDAAPLIFIGRVAGVEGYPEVPAQDALVEQGAGGIAWGVPMAAIDWRLEVEQVLRDDGRIAGGAPIILRQVGMNEEAYAFLQKQGGGYEGRRYLFLLTPNPDGKTYRAHYAIWSQLEIDGAALRLSNETRPPLYIPIDDDSALITLEQLVEFIKEQ